MNKPSIRAGETHTRPAAAVKTVVVAESISSDSSSLLFNKRPLARIQKPPAHGELTFKDSESGRNQNSSPANSSKRATLVTSTNLETGLSDQSHARSSASKTIKHENEKRYGA